MYAGHSDMQRMKGQGTSVPNGPKDQNYSSFQSYTSPMTSSMAAAAAASDPYMSSYYMTSTPYQAFGVGDGTWSNGGDHMQTFLGGYGGQMGYDSHSAIDGMFGSGSFGGFNPPGFNYGFHGNGDYNAWGGSDVRGGNKPYDDYYQRDNLYTDDRVKALDQGVQGLTITDPKTGQDLPREGGSGIGKNAATNGSSGVEVKPNGGSSPGGEASVGLGQTKKGMSWASIASQPAKPQPKGRRDKTTMSSIVPGRHMDIGTWEGKNGGGPKPVAPPPVPRPAWEAPRGGSRSTTSTSYSTPPPRTPPQVPPPQQVQQSGQQQSAQQQEQPQLQPLQTSPPQHQQSPHQQHAHQNVHQQHLHQQHQHQQQQQQQHQHQQLQQQLSPSPQQQQQTSPQPLLPSGVMHATMELPPSSQSGPPMSVSQRAPLPHVPGQIPAELQPDDPILEGLRMRNDYNPKDFDLNPKNARFFVIKSYSEDDIHRSIKYEIWCSTEHGNKRLDSAFREREGKGPVYLFFSVNGSGHFCGLAQMISIVDYNSSSSVWAQDKWKGQFRVKWIYVKDVPNNQLRHIRLENNENKPVTNSRDTQEVLFEKGKQVLKIINQYRHTTSIFDDFSHYEKRQEESETRRNPGNPYKDMERDDRRNDRMDHRDHRDHRDHARDHRDHRDNRDHYHRDHRDQRDHRDHREHHRGGMGGGRGRGGHHPHHRGARN